MAEIIPQSVAYLVVFRAFLASDGKTVATGKTIAITISKNGGAFGNPNAGATNATEISSGFYKFTLDTTDTGTLGPLAWRGAEAAINDAGDVLTVAAATNGGFSALPNAAADAAGGLPISDAGGLDLDTKLANTNEITVARMGALTDWINGGRLDLILDIIAADTTTDIPALIGTPVVSVSADIAAIQADLDAGATIADIVDGVLDEATSGHATAGTVGKAIADAATAPGLVTTLTTKTLKYAQLTLRKDAAIATDNATEVGEINADEGSGAGAFANTTDSQEAIADGAGGTPPTAAAIADAVWDEAATGHTDAGKAGAQLWTQIDAVKAETASIQTDTNDLQTQVGVAGAGLTNINLPNQTMDIVGNITGNLSGSVGSVTGAVGSVTGAVGSVTGLTAADVGAIKAKTDSLTFTKALEVDANIQSINGTAVNGDGSATPWGP